MHSAQDHSPSQVITEAIGRILQEGSRAVLATLIQAEKGVGGKLLLNENGDSWGSLGDADLDEAVRRQATTFLASREEASALMVREFAPSLEASAEARVLFERIEGEPRLVVCGAGHVGASLARLASLIGYRVTLIDDRAEFVKRESFSEYAIEPVVAESWADTVRTAIGNGRGVSVAIVTRGHKEDEECLRAIVSNVPDYVGLIGSKRRTNFVLEKLREEGVAAEKLKQVRAPIGLDLGAVSPEEVALAILAEIVAQRRGGKGASLSDWRRS
ncbi:MAG: XdhC family protein [Pyrinomonadaceae bacterium]